MQIELFTLSWCEYCSRARALLDRHGVVYREVCLDRDPRGRMDIRSRSGRATLPQLFVDGRHIGDCDELHALERQGRLRLSLGLPDR
ncbi:MAG TPA: glutaredoxin domain-containing protein [Candidatus Acidoferrales bacterium]|nr:glutaredoxin domain-containing protein [Candidatus Acidoferrales bacterium]